jgi:ABC-type multidrug transport system fused ATPase/permease subunit
MHAAKSEVLVVARVQRLLFTSLLTQDIATFDREGTGKLVSRLTSDVKLIGQVLSTNVNVILQQGLLLVGSLAALFRLSPQPALVYTIVTALWVVRRYFLLES